MFAVNVMSRLDARRASFTEVILGSRRKSKVISQPPP